MLSLAAIVADDYEGGCKIFSYIVTLGRKRVVEQMRAHALHVAQVLALVDGLARQGVDFAAVQTMVPISRRAWRVAAT
jgi:hypothetical protein